MTEYIVLSRYDMRALCDDKPITVFIDKKPYVLCTDECFEKQQKGDEDNADENGSSSD